MIRMRNPVARALAAASILLLAACETMPVADERLSSDRIALVIDAASPDPMRQVAESRTGEGAWQGVKKGAAIGALPGLAIAATPDPSGLSLVVGAALLAVGAPVGAVVGAVAGAGSADEQFTDETLAGIGGAAVMAEKAFHRDAFAAALASELSRLQTPANGARADSRKPELTMAGPDDAASREALKARGFDGRLDVVIRKHGLRGRPGEDARLSLILDLTATLTPADEAPAQELVWTYKSEASRVLAEWAADDGRAVHDELPRAAEALVAHLAMWLPKAMAEARRAQGGASTTTTAK